MDFKDFNIPILRNIYKCKVVKSIPLSASAFESLSAQVCVC